MQWDFQCSYWDSKDGYQMAVGMAKLAYTNGRYGMWMDATLPALSQGLGVLGMGRGGKVM